MKRSCTHIGAFWRVVIVFASVFTLTTFTVFAQARSSELLRINIIERESRLEMSLTALPTSTLSELNPAKDRITITLPGASIESSFAEPLGKGVVEDVFVRSSADGLKVFIDLSARRGFAVSTLPYSSRVQVHMFDWNALSPSDNALYSGMLAEESGVAKAAGEEYQRAVDAGNGRAAAYYGLLLLKQGKLAEAQLMLYKARSLSSDIPDIYAGLAEIHGKLGDRDKQRQFEQLFEDKTGRRPAPIASSTAAGADEILEPQSLASRLDVFDTPVDSSEFAAQDSSSLVDSSALANAQSDTSVTTAQDSDSTESNRFSQLFADEGHKLKAERQNPMTVGMPDWLKDSLMIGFLLLFVVGIGLIVAYILWRRKKLTKSSVPFAKDFANEMDSALRDLSDVYSQDLNADSSTEQSTKRPSSPEQPAEEHEAASTTNNREQSEDKSVSALEEEFLLSSLHEPVEPRGSDLHKAGENSQDMRNLSARMRRGEGELELSMNMASAQEMERLQSLSSIDSEAIPENNRDKRKFAQQVHAESSALDLKKKMSMSGKAKSAFSKLFSDKS